MAASTLSSCTSTPFATPTRPHHSRPSPTKRSHSSPNSSPPLGHSQESPRVLRTKFSNTLDAGELVEAVERPLGLGLRRDLSHGDDARKGMDATPSTPPSPGGGGKMIELGVGLEDRTKAGIEISAGATQTAAAEDQTRRLAAMPLDLHYALARLSSQHHQSEYNTLKRTVAVAANQPPYPPPLRAVPIQRSYSSPPLGSTCPSTPQTYPRPCLQRYQSALVAPLSTAAPLAVRPPVAHASTTWPSDFRSSLTPEPSEGAVPAPNRSRASTPPPMMELASLTMALTPTLANLAFDSSASTPLNGPGMPDGHLEQQRDIATELRDALQSKMERTIVVGGREETGARPTNQPFKAPPHAQPPPAPKATDVLLPGMRLINGVAVKTSASHPMNISALIPPEYLPHLATNLLGASSPKSPLQPSSALNSSTPATPSTTPFLLESHPACSLYSLTSLTTFSPSLGGGGATTKKLGNFMLSSCPGKKVRMDGAPVRGGRSAICRDVKMDLERAKQEGVRVVVCCLDDQELAFLGAPWEEYSRVATSLSLSVIRIPMVEGFAPSCPAALDAQLSRIIRSHTLRGESVLAHCRGGIGRAGLVACCWMLKMGLIGGASEEGEREGADLDGERAMRVVERVIEVIRKRRSVKSIETPVQVAFLLSYVSFLQSHATIVKACDI